MDDSCSVLWGQSGTRAESERRTKGTAPGFSQKGSARCCSRCQVHAAGTYGGVEEFILVCVRVCVSEGEADGGGDLCVSLGMPDPRLGLLRQPDERLRNTTGTD